MTADDVAALWRDEALLLVEENRQLRVMMTRLLLTIAARDELLAFGRGVIETRWPRQDREAA